MTGDYSLSPLSPAIDGGHTNAFEGWESDKDILGAPRLANGKPDIGAYEYQADRLDGHILALATSTRGDPVRIEARAFSPDPSATIRYRWTTSDGHNGDWTDNPVLEHPFPANGTQTVSVAVSDGASQIEKTATIYIGPKDLYVVHPEALPATHPVAPYDTPETATTSIQEALAYAADGSTIHLGPGNHGLDEELIIDKGVALVGTEGAEETVVRRTDTKFINSSRKPFLQHVIRIDHPRAVVKGLSITKGWIYGISMVSLYDDKAGAGVLICRRGGILDSCIVTNNQSRETVSGAGVAVTSRDGVVTNCVIAGNSISGWNTDGGGLFLGDGTACSSFIHSNTNEARNAAAGGGVHATSGTISKCRIVNNLTVASGGGLYCNGNVLVRNCLFADNRANGRGGGVQLNSGHLVHCTIAGNLAVQQAGGVYAESRSSCLVEGSILAENRIEHAIDKGTADWELGANAIVNGCLSPAPFPCKGTDNIVGSPAFRDIAQGDYTLTSSSDAIDRTPVSYYGGMEQDTDLAGERRKIGSAADIGAYEYQADELDVNVALPSSPLSGHAATFSAVAFTPVAGATLSYRWNFGDGSEWTGWTHETTVFHTFAKPGRYQITLEVTDGTSTLTSTDPLFIAAQEIHVLNAALHPDHVPDAPYDTPAKAANSIGEAIRWAGDGTTIHVGEGVYETTAEIILERGIKLLATEGATRTEIRRVETDIKQNSSVTILQRALRIDHPDAKVEGFTVSGGWILAHPLNNSFSDELSGSGVLIGSRGGTLSGCIVTNNRSRWVVQGGGVAVLNGGLVTNCLIRKNQVDGWIPRGGGAYVAKGGTITHSAIVENLIGDVNSPPGGGVFVNGGHLSHCLVATNGVFSKGCKSSGGGIAASSSTSTLVDNCLVIGNACTDRGGGLYAEAGTFVNLTIADNGANLGGGVFATSDKVALLNCIIQGNRVAGDATDGAPEWNGAKANYSHSISPRPLPTADAGNLSTDALFVENGYELAPRLTLP